MMRTVVDLVKHAENKVEFISEDIIKGPPALSRKRHHRMPEGRKIFSDLVVLENLKIGAYLRNNNWTDDLNWGYARSPRLKERQW